MGLVSIVVLLSLILGGGDVIGLTGNEGPAVRYSGTGIAITSNGQGYATPVAPAAPASTTTTTTEPATTTTTTTEPPTTGNSGPGATSAIGGPAETGRGDAGGDGTGSAASTLPPEPSGRGVAPPPGAAETPVSGVTNAPVQRPFAMGDSTNGQTGTGTGGASVMTPSRVAVSTSAAFSAVAAGASHTLAVDSNGFVYSWGSNAFGQLGRGPASGQLKPVVVPMPTSSPAVAVAAGASFSLALEQSGRLFAWGSNLFGQLGDGTNQGHRTPAQVEAPAGVTFTAIAAGAETAYALSSTGTIYAWGDNLLGQLGNGTTADSTTPVPLEVPGVTFDAISAGAGFCLALSSSGQVYAWGMNGSGQLGDGTQADSDVPTPIAAPAGVSFQAVAAGGEHALALTTTGTVYTWGSDAFGQLGNGTQAADSTVPVITKLPPDVAFSEVSATANASYAVSQFGTLFAWGGNFYGQLGDGSTISSLIPEKISVAPGATAAVLVQGSEASVGGYVTGASQTITLPSLNDEGYGAAPVPVSATSSSGLPVTITASGACTYPQAQVFFTGAGTCTIEATQDGNAQYDPAAPVTETLQVAPAPLTITARDVSGATGEPPPPFTFKVSGLVHDDTSAAVQGAPDCTTTATSSSPPGQYPITCTVGTLSAANYTFSQFLPGTLTLVTPVVGYALVGSDGSVYVQGPTVQGTPAQQYYGSMAGQPLNAPIVGAALTPDRGGYWLVASDGGIFAFGDAGYYGSTGGSTLDAPIVAMAATADGRGYWLVAADGGVFAFGDAGYYGSAVGLSLNEPVVAMAPTPDGQGYWLVAGDGGVFAFGDAPYLGSGTEPPGTSQFNGIAPAPDGKGYWLSTMTGLVQQFGTAPFEGDLRYVGLQAPVVGIAPTSQGDGYWLASSDGGLFAFGSAGYFGNAGTPSATIVAVI